MNASFLSNKYTLLYNSAKMPGGTEQFNQNKLNRALQLQKPLFVIEDSQITPQAAKEFLEQADSQGDGIEPNQVMREEAVDALDIRIMTDDTIKHLLPAQLANWKELPILTIAELVVRYFGMRPETGETLTQAFEKVAFQYCYDDPNLEVQTMREYTSVARTFAMEHPQMTLEQKRDLVKLVEKRFPPGSQIQTDYLQLKLIEDLRDEETWRSCLVRFIKVLNNARRAQMKVTKYGNQAVMYSYPPTPRARSSDLSPAHTVYI